MAKVSIGLYAIDKVLGHDFANTLDFVKGLEAMGVDMITAHDHVAIGNFSRANYPGTKTGFPGEPDDPWPESVALLAAISAVTTKLRLGASVLVAPLRHTVLLAKQLSTLDYMSGGRTEIGLGAGWQEDEFQASGIDFKKRFAYLDEQIQAMRQLWTKFPASYQGELIAFDELFVKPAPVQNPLPIWLGILKVTDKGIDRMGRLADGWFAGHDDPDVMAQSIARVHESLRRYGRDPKDFRVHVDLPPVYRADGSADLEGTFRPVRDYIKCGVTHIGFIPSRYFSDRKSAEDAIKKLLAIAK